jgi:glutamine synthetase
VGASKVAVDLEDLQKDLSAAGVRNVVGTVVDNSGVTRVKCFPLGKLPSAASSGIGISEVMPLYLVNDHFATGAPISGPTGDLRLFPDIGCLVQLASAPGWAWAPFDQHGQDRKESPGCQRSLLRRMVDAAGSRGYTLKMAYELEWFVCRASEKGLLPIHCGPGYSANAWAASRPLVDDLLAALEIEGLMVEQFHPEYAVGQLEVSLPVADPLRAADSLVLLKMTIRTWAENHGLLVSFSPISVAGQVGNGCHVHFSLWDSSGGNLFASGDEPLRISRVGERFIAGVLTELPALVSLSCPSVLSYSRIQPHLWAGAFQCWGHENREAALRFITGTSGIEGRGANMEFKSADPAANPYLVAGAIIAAGLAGIDRDLRLPPPVAEDPGNLSEEDRRRLNISHLPESVEDAADALANSETLKAAIGEFLTDCIVAVRRSEAKAFAGVEFRDLVEQHLWRY